jgi:hypothetical protein
LVPEKNVPFHAALKKQKAGRSAKSYRELRRKIQVQYYQKVFGKVGSPPERPKSTPKTTARQQSVIKAWLKILTQNFFSAKSIYKCVIDDESYTQKSFLFSLQKLLY